MAERTTQLRPLGEKGIETNVTRLSYSRIMHERNGRNFTDFGTFELDEVIVGITNYHTMWAQRLLGYSPENYELTIWNKPPMRPQLLVRDLQHSVLKSIPPEDIREVGPMEAKMGEVYQSGYVLADHFYHLGKRQWMKALEFEEILRETDLGTEPSDFDPYTRVKVDPALCGKKLWFCIFEFELDRGLWDRDAVVIDPETRTMVPREVSRPLAAESWGKTYSIPTPKTIMPSIGMVFQ